MSPDEPSGPDLADGADSDAAVLCFLAHAKAVRLRDGKQLTLDDIAGAEHLRVMTRHGIVDIMRGGLPPLDYETVAARAMDVSLGGRSARVASLSSIVGFKRLAGRARDRNDLEELEAFHGELPIEPIPGLDS